MAITRSPTVVGVFDDRDGAQRAVAELRQAGFRDDDIGFVARVKDAAADEPRTGEGGAIGTKGTEGAIVGATAGGVISGLLGLATVGLTAGIGPLIFGGVLAAALGANAGGLAGALIGLGIPEHEAGSYERALEGDRLIVVVRAPDRGAEAAAILRQHGAREIER